MDRSLWPFVTYKKQQLDLIRGERTTQIKQAALDVFARHG
jgi:hypothetical protein